MARFGLGMMGDFEDDPFFGSHVRQMNQVMNSMFADPFGLMGMGTPMLGNGHHQQVAMSPMPTGMQMVPFGFPMMPSLPMNRMFAGLGNMTQDPSCHSFSSSSIMTMTSSGPDGRPQVYQETMSTRSAPGGVKETKKTVSDSRSGTRSMAIGHHIGERAHILEREHNLHSGEQEERQEFINLEEEEAEGFNYEWEARTRRSAGAIAGSRARNPYSRSLQENKPLALPSTVPSSSEQCKSQQSRPLARPRKGIRSGLSVKNSSLKSSSRSSENCANTASESTTTTSAFPSELDSTATTTSSPTAAKGNSSRKRQHSPEPDLSEDDVATAAAPNKRISPSSPSDANRDPIPCIDVTD